MGEIVPNQLFVAGYSRNKVTDERDVKEIFRKYASVKEVAYKGSYSFITFNSEAEAQEALKETNGMAYNGQKLKVDIVDKRKSRKTGPSEGDQCFKCNKGGHWARDCPNGRSPHRSRRYSNSRSRRHRRRSDSRSYSSQSSSRSRRKNRSSRNKHRHSRSRSPKRQEKPKKRSISRKRSPSDSQSSKRANSDSKS
ncbi:unnamed protein product [Paramecium pentaurelia]|uniref:Uncharacterized protein n=1 Tax=Paramecium pentaurelia TaxID=43138 RepID=A0A8S1YA14_9CILI|nr:unnamed protein product [Paramecium pentaurelia]